MTNIFDTLITIVVGTITGVTQAVTNTVAALQDFFYVKVAGVSFIVLGARQTGKTTLIEWLAPERDDQTGHARPGIPRAARTRNDAAAPMNEFSSSTAP